jgi:hypothetical protein
MAKSKIACKAGPVYGPRPQNERTLTHIGRQIMRTIQDWNTIARGVTGHWPDDMMPVLRRSRHLPVTRSTCAPDFFIASSENSRGQSR